MNRRGFLAAMLATATLDPERLLWRPGEKMISIPRIRRWKPYEIDGQFLFQLHSPEGFPTNHAVWWKQFDDGKIEEYSVNLMGTSPIINPRFSSFFPRHPLESISTYRRSLADESLIFCKTLNLPHPDARRRG